MQLCARNEKDLIIFAHQAEKQRNFFCLECRGVVRLRGGMHRQPHFYHLKPSASCRQSGKSMEHLQVQCYLKELFGNACVLEHPFPQIRRIADCACPAGGLVFEVQCSPITQEEVAARNADYAAAGYRVIWVLHDRQFNRHRLSAAELWLRGHPHYFTNIDADGAGHIYDQVDRAQAGFRKVLLKSAQVDLRQMYGCVEYSLAALLAQRNKDWQLGFQGDWVHLSQKEEYSEHIQEALAEATPTQKNRLSFIPLLLWQRCIAAPYRILFAYLLEKACR